MFSRIYIKFFSLILLVTSVLLLSIFLISIRFNFDFLPVLMTSIALLVVLIPILIFQVGRPLLLIQKALNTENPSLVEKLVKSKNDFGQLASLTLRSFHQKKELLAEISERKKAEEALRESEERYRSLVETSPDAILLSDLSGKVLLSNQSALTLFECTSETFPDETSFFDLIPDDAREQIEKIYKEIKTKERIKAVECTMRKSTGAPFFAEANFSLVKSQNITGALICIIRDITDKKNSEFKKAKLEEQFRAVYKMEAIGQLAGGIAHDFNNILGAISGYADIIRHRYTGDEKLEKYAQMILSAATRASDLTSKLLTFARKSKLQMAPFDIHSLLRDMIELLEHTIDKNISIKSDLQAQDSIILGDTSQFQSAVMNLALNARDAMSQGGQLTFYTVNVNLDQNFSNSRAYIVAPGDYISVSVKDTGTGMDKQVMEHLFEPFFTTKELGKGTGLGLASVYGTVKSHNGYIDVESEPEKGTTITIYLPVANQNKCRNPKTPKVYKQGKGHILVVDDERFMVDAVREMLSWLGYTVCVSLSGTEAIELFKSEPDGIDLVIMDMMMPGMNGRECFRRMKEIDKDVKVLLSTGYRIDEERQNILDEGILGIIQKPFVSAQLAQAVQNIISK